MNPELTAIFQGAIVLSVIILGIVVAGKFGMGGEQDEDDWGGPK